MQNLDKQTMLNDEHDAVNTQMINITYQHVLALIPSSAPMLTGSARLII